MSRLAVIAALLGLLAACGGESRSARAPQPARPAAPAGASGELSPELANLLLQGPGGPVEEGFALDRGGDEPVALRIVLEPAGPR